MTSPIDPIRRPQPPRKARKASVDQTDDVHDSGSDFLPVPVGAARTHEPPPPAQGAASIEAQILGQTGARRGLRAGPTVIDTAQHAYNKTEWSGEKDRRAPKGRAAKTDV